jgi:hypothetical protein
MYNLTTTEFVLRNKNNSTKSLPCLLSSLAKLYLSQFLCKLHAKRAFVCYSHVPASKSRETPTCTQYSRRCQARSPRKFTLRLFFMLVGTSFHVVKAYDTIPHRAHVPQRQQFTFPGRAAAVSKDLNIFHFH